MIINNWYVAAVSDELKDEPMGVRMLGVDLVLFRGKSDQIACLSSVCCHRGGSLSRGVISGGCVKCPYHGWEYNRAGHVTKIPALGDEAKIPKRARVDSYPVQEKYGHVWVFLGDLPEAERPALPDILPEYEDREGWRMMRYRKDWPANWMRLSENFADTYHIPFVHKFGKHLGDSIEFFEVEEKPWGAKVVQNIGARPKEAQENPAMIEALPDKRKPTELSVEVSLIGMMQRNHQDLAPGITQLLWNAWVPVDEGRTRHFGLHFRNFKTEADYDDDMLAAVYEALEEDVATLEYLTPEVSPPTTKYELFTKSDSFEATIRRKTLQISNRLGAVDMKKLAEEQKYRALVIPSPERRQDPNNWLHDTVPLMPADEAGAPSAAAE